MEKSTIKVKPKIHGQLKEIASKEGKGIQELAEEYLSYCIKQYYSDETLQVTNIEKIINNRISKTEEQLNRGIERLAGLEARVGIDNSMSLMGVITLLEKLLKLDRKDIQAELRKQGAIYFSGAIKEDKDNKKKEGK